MSQIKVKICGLRRPEDIAAANELKPDYIGFILVEGKARTVSIPQAVALKKALDPSIPAVGVFMNQPMEYILETYQAGAIDMIQLHGKEDNAYIDALREKLQAVVPAGVSLPTIIKAAAVKGAEDIANAVKTSADLLLLDNKIPGSGQSFDWTLLKDVEREFILAGGLNMDNLAEALEVGSMALDVSSGVETDGVKDYEKMKAFLETARA